MLMKKNSLLISCLVSAALVSCNDAESVLFEENGTSQILFSIDEFVPEIPDTRTNCDPSSNYAITWADGDMIGVFPREGDQEPFTIPTDQVGKSSASFDGGYWALKDGKTYNAYYPFSLDNFASSDMKTMIPVSYLGQYQNGTDCCVGNYDYTYSDWATSVGGSAVSFKFHHLGSFLVLTLPIPFTAQYTTLSVSTDAAVIPVKGTYDLTAATPAFIPTQYASSLSMTLNNFNGVAGQNATFYMMVPPVDLSNRDVMVILSSQDLACSYKIESKNIVASKLYKLSGVLSHRGHEFVDLGLPSGTMWATCNIGANSSEFLGSQFAWGETVTKSTFTKENYSYYDAVDKTYFFVCYDVLPFTKDAAWQTWGEDWYMPTIYQFKELYDNCIWTSTVLNGGNVYKIEGANGNWIYLPRGVSYWTRELLFNYDDNWVNNGYAKIFNPSNPQSSVKGLTGSLAWYGMYIRPVTTNGIFWK